MIKLEVIGLKDKNKQTLEILKNLNIAEAGLYLTIKNYMEDYIYGIDIETLYQSNLDDKEVIDELLDSLVNKGYIEVKDYLISIKNYTRRIRLSDFKKIKFSTDSSILFPRMFFTDDIYKKISSTSKVLYIFCLDILEPLGKRGNTNKKGEICFPFKKELFVKALGEDINNIENAIEELKDINLIDIDEEQNVMYVHFIF